MRQVGAGALFVQRVLLGSLVFFPSRDLGQTPSDVGVAFRELSFTADDGRRLHGWWLPTTARGRLGQILFCHGNAGNIGDRLLEALVLTGAGFDVLLFDYRGYGRSSGRPDEQGTYRDARAARAALLAQAETDPARVIYVGESLGGAVALRLAVEFPPRAWFCSQRSRASVTSLATTTRSSHRCWSPTGIRAAGSSRVCVRHCWCCTATATTSSRSSTARRCATPPRSRSGCTSSPTAATTTSLRCPEPSIGP